MAKHILNKTDRKMRWKLNASKILILGLLCFSIFSQAVAQEKITITGKVADKYGEPVPGLTVVEKGTTNGIITNLDGEYTITVSNNASILAFSFVGMETQEIQVNNNLVINVTMEDSSIELEEVVAIGYGSVKKGDLTGAVATISGDDLEKVPVTSLDQSLQGMASGVQVTQLSAQPGGATSIRIRGGNSVFAGNEPLYVIDGTPVLSSNNFSWIGGPEENALSSLNPNDIESISILKDASATSIYGARGSNGVVLITTKRGKSGSDKIAFDAYYGIQQQAKGIEVMNATQFAQLFDEAGQNATPNDEIYNPLYPNPETLGEGTDWQKEIYRTAPIQNYQLSISGGDEKTTYAVSGNYFKQDGIIIGSDYERYSGRINLDRKVNNYIKFGSNVSLTSTTSNTVGSSTQGGFFPGVVNTALTFNPVLPVYDSTGKYTLTDPNADAWLDNPVAVTREVDAVSKVLRTLANIYGEFEIIQGLKLKISGGVDSYKNTQDMYTPRFIYSGSFNDGQARFATTAYTTLLNENTLTYSKTINHLHKLDLVGGFTFQKTDQRSYINISTGFPNDNLGYYGIYTATKMPNILTSFSENMLISYLGRVNYNYNEKYLFTLTGRADGSSAFGPNNRFAFFPSLAFAWRVSEEDFFKKSIPSAYVKMRASIGRSGNDKIGDYQYIPKLSSTIYYFNNAHPAPGYALGNIGNEVLMWETTNQADLGIDLGFFGNRLMISSDLYYKRTVDMLYEADLPYTSGFSKTLLNIGKMENKGIEFTINGQPIRGEFNWSSDLNISFNKNKVLDLNENEDLPITNDEYKLKIGTWAIVREGEEMGSFYGYLSDGIWQLGEEEEAAIYGAEPGDFKYIDKNNDGILDTRDQQIIGHAQPDFIFSFNNTLSYKGIELSLFFQGQFGNQILNSNRFELESGNGLSNASSDLLSRWSPENPSNTYPRANRDADYLRSSDRYLEDGSYLRLKAISLAYFIPVKKSNVIQNAKIYVTAKNLFTLTNYSGFDPEVGRFGQDNKRQGYDYGGYPSAKTYLVGLSIGF